MCIRDSTDRVWEEVKPLYDALQCHVRDKLHEEYGDDIVPSEGMLPAHILGNMSVSYTHLRAHETKANLVCRLLLEKKKTHTQYNFVITHNTN